MVEIITGCVAPVLVPTSDGSGVICPGASVMKLSVITTDTDIDSKGGRFRWRQCEDR